MNLKYLIECEGLIKKIGGEKLGNKQAFNFSKMYIRLYQSIDSIFDLNNEQILNIKKGLNVFKDSQNLIKELYDDFFLIEDISNRYLMIKELLEKEKELKFGLLGLTLYLGLTCFDSLGQKERYKTFNDWLTSKDNDVVKKLQSRLDNNESIKLKTEIAQLFDEYYNPTYGMRNSFFNFLDEIKGKNSYKELLKTIDIGDKCIKEKLEQNGDLETIKKMWLFHFRNDFTHNTRNLRWVLDNDRFYPLFSINSQNICINIIPNRLVVNILDCIKDGIEIKLKKLGINLI